MLLLTARHGFTRFQFLSFGLRSKMYEKLTFESFASEKFVSESEHNRQHHHHCPNRSDCHRWPFIILEKKKVNFRYASQYIACDNWTTDVSTSTIGYEFIRILLLCWFDVEWLRQRFGSHRLKRKHYFRYSVTYSVLTISLLKCLFLLSPFTHMQCQWRHELNEWTTRNSDTRIYTDSRELMERYLYLATNIAHGIYKLIVQSSYVQ